MIVRTVAERISSGVREIWEDYIPLDLAVAGFESVPEILRATSGDAPVLVASIEVKAAGRDGLSSRSASPSACSTPSSPTPRPPPDERDGVRRSSAASTVEVVEGSLRVTDAARRRAPSGIPHLDEDADLASGAGRCCRPAFPETRKSRCWSERVPASAAGPPGWVGDWPSALPTARRSRITGQSRATGLKLLAEENLSMENIDRRRGRRHSR